MSEKVGVVGLFGDEEVGGDKMEKGDEEAERLNGGGIAIKVGYLGYEIE